MRHCRIGEAIKTKFYVTYYTNIFKWIIVYLTFIFTFKKYIYIHTNLIIFKNPPHLLTCWYRNQIIDLLKQKCEKNTWRRDFKKRPCILTENSILGQFSVSACVNQPPGFDSQLVIPNNQWGKQINALLQTTPLTIG